MNDSDMTSKNRINEFLFYFSSSWQGKLLFCTFMKSSFMGTW
jgi:hypothetical protein